MGNIFDPECEGYDMESALAAGLSADPTGHWPSRLPDTGLLLKGRRHKTWPLTVQGETEAGFKIIFKDGRYYSVPVNGTLEQIKRMNEALIWKK